jgi:CAAX protease family protein
VTIGSIRHALRETRFVTPELAITAALFILASAGLLPLAGTPVLVAWALLSFWVRGEGVWRGVGLERRPYWARMAIAGLALGVAWLYASVYALEPLISRVTGALPDVSLFAGLTGNRQLLVVSLAASWTLAAVGEEYVYRGYLMRRIAQALGGSRRAWIAALAVTSLVFAVGHLYQGVSGAISAGCAGLVLGGAYLASGRNLWVPILAHGANDTVGFVLLYLGKYPGV